MSAARSPCWCSGAAPDLDFEAPTCACVMFRCAAHRDGETCLAGCRTLWGTASPGEPEELDEDDPGLA
jgi:hypothetical protein